MTRGLIGFKDVWWQLVSVTELTSFNKKWNWQGCCMSTDIIKCQKKYISFKEHKSNQHEGARKGWVGVSGPRLCAVKEILFLFMSTLIHCQLIFFSRVPLQPPLQNVSQEIPLSFMIWKAKSIWRCSPLRYWRAPELEAEDEVGCQALHFYCQYKIKDWLALRLKTTHKPRSGMYAYCASIYTLIS